ncbi:MAG TPA: hypothetical protein PKZ60_01970, partial [Candidatus Saccharicenans sp.]|nr:hypothetical protein [Candidatus Saccharicenans sp.]
PDLFFRIEACRIFYIAFLFQSKKISKNFCSTRSISGQKEKKSSGLPCQVISEGIEKGRFIQISPAVIVKYIRAMIEGLVYSRFWEEKRLSAQQETDQMFRLLMEGIATKPLQKGEDR